LKNKDSTFNCNLGLGWIGEDLELLGLGVFASDVSRKGAETQNLAGFSRTIQ